MTFNIKKICCIGAGYVGGPTMAVIADRCPNLVINVVDLNLERINAWNDPDLSKLPVYEPGLDEVIKRCRNRNLYFSNEIEKHISSADMIFISVNTPTKIKGVGAGQASDIKWVEKSARQVANYAKGTTIVVEKSTLPVKTAETIKAILEITNQKQTINTSNKQFFILSNPEFLAEGTAIKDLENPDRVLIGGDNQEAINALENIYLNWISGEKIIKTNLWSSELSKLTANAFLAQKISSINSISAICEETGANIKEVAQAIGMDTRIGNKFLSAGPGFGGSCFKKDILNLVYLCNHFNLPEVARYWQNVIEINEWQNQRVSKVIVNKLFGTISEKRIAILGFSFKANTNDTRESPAIGICRDLIEEGSSLAIYDPRVEVKQIKQCLENMKDISDVNKSANWHLAESVIEAVTGADAIVIVTDWAEFKSLNWKQISIRMRAPSWLFDTRNVANIEEVKKHGINFWGVGCGSYNK